MRKPSRWIRSGSQRERDDVTGADSGLYGVSSSAQNEIHEDVSIKTRLTHEIGPLIEKNSSIGLSMDLFRFDRPIWFWYNNVGIEIQIETEESYDELRDCAR